MGHAYAFVHTISRHGRRFFVNYESSTFARLELDGPRRVCWIDEYRGTDLHRKDDGCGHVLRGFSHGSTLLSLVESLRDYIKRGDLLHRETNTPSYINSLHDEYRATAKKLSCAPKRTNSSCSSARCSAERNDAMMCEQCIDSLPTIRGPRGRPRRWPAKLHPDIGYDFARCRAYR